MAGASTSLSMERDHVIPRSYDVHKLHIKYYCIYHLQIAIQNLNPASYCILNDPEEVGHVHTHRQIVK